MVLGTTGTSRAKGKKKAGLWQREHDNNVVKLFFCLAGLLASLSIFLNPLNFFQGKMKNPAGTVGANLLDQFRQWMNPRVTTNFRESLALGTFLPSYFS